MPDISHAARAVLSAAEPRDKIRAARAAARDWRLGRLTHDFTATMPDAPSRPTRPDVHHARCRAAVAAAPTQTAS